MSQRMVGAESAGERCDCAPRGVGSGAKLAEALLGLRQQQQRLPDIGAELGLARPILEQGQCLGDRLLGVRKAPLGNGDAVVNTAMESAAQNNLAERRITGHFFG